MVDHLHFMNDSLFDKLVDVGVIFLVISNWINNRFKTTDNGLTTKWINNKLTAIGLTDSRLIFQIIVKKTDSGSFCWWF